MSVVWQQQVGAIFKVLEGYVRGRSRPFKGTLAAEVQAVVEGFLDLCFARLRLEKPQLLLVLAWGGSSEQQVAFFNLLLSLLKLSGSGGIADGPPSPPTASNRL